jgi:hypothetical protein
MSWTDHDNIHVSHDALIAFAWSAPMRDLAAKVGISDVGLKKLLRGHGVVTPPQGHWNRVHAGKPVPDRPKAPPRQPGETGRISLDSRFRGLIEETPGLPVEGPFASAAVPEDLDDLRARELKAIGRVAAPRNLDNPHAGLVQLLRREAERREKAEAERWYFNKPVFDTPLGQRRLRLLNGLFHALGRRGHSGSVWEQNGELSARCTIGDMALGLSLTMVGKHRTETIAGYRRPARDLAASTPLCLTLDRKLRSDVRAAWQDDASGKLETRLAAIAADIIVAGEAAFRQGLIEAVEWEEQQRKWKEERRRERMAELEAERLEGLKTSGRLLAQAEEIRFLVERVKAAVLAGSTDVTPVELAAWERWAGDYADRLDPVLSGQILSHIRLTEPD